MCCHRSVSWEASELLLGTPRFQQEKSSFHSLNIIQVLKIKAGWSSMNRIDYSTLRIAGSSLARSARHTGCMQPPGLTNRLPKCNTYTPQMLWPWPFGLESQNQSMVILYVFRSTIQVSSMTKSPMHSSRSQNGAELQRKGLIWMCGWRSCAKTLKLSLSLRELMRDAHRHRGGAPHHSTPLTWESFPG